MTGPVAVDGQPVDLDLLLFVDANGDRRFGVPNPFEQRLAEALLRDRVLWRYADANTLATVLAAVREGSTLTGQRREVGCAVRVGGEVWRREPGAEAVARERCRTGWARRLARDGLRPVGWPPIEVTPLRWPTRSDSASVTRDSMMPTNVDHCDVVLVAISGPAVPE